MVDIQLWHKLAVNTSQENLLYARSPAERSVYLYPSVVFAPKMRPSPPYSPLGLGAERQVR